MGGSTSHKRRSPRRGGGGSGRNNRARPTAAIPVPQRTLTFDDHTITNGLGYDLLSRAGWKAGTSLGASPARSNTIAPIPIVVRPPRLGIGLSPSSLPTPTAISKQAPEPVFDPLRPRCRFDHTHIVASLKALQKHECNCPSNPARHQQHHHHSQDDESHDSQDEDFEDYSDISDSDSDSESDSESDNLNASSTL